MLGRLKRIARLAARKRDQYPRVEPLEPRELLTLFTVTSAADSGTGSLRAAIQLANADNTIGGDSIAFSIGNGPQTIALQSALPTITRTIAIDGTTQPHTGTSTGAPLITIDGTNAGAGSNGLTLQGLGGSAVRGLAIVNFKAATTGGGRGILVTDGGNDTFLGNYLGVDPNGTTARPNAVGIEIRSAKNVVGDNGTAATSSFNLISGNASDGVLITGTAATGNLVVGNRIGTDASGTAALGNLHGVTIASASNNTIGGATTTARNVISGNAGSDSTSGIGVYITGTASGNVISGNEIGTDLTGTKMVYNTYGIYLGTVGGANRDPVTATTIGSATVGGGNLISGNGIGITGNVFSSLIAGNLIGTDITGRQALSNGYGIYLGATGSTIGGTGAAMRNVIAASGLSGFGGTGIYLTGDANAVQGNYIGTTSDGITALPNQVGMDLHVTNSSIGGATTGAGNVVAGNTGAGIVLDSNGSNRLFGNRIGANANGAALGNGGNGISVILTGATSVLPLNDTIGSTTAGAGNLITANGGAGVGVTASNVSYTGLTIRGDQISNNGQLGISLGSNPTVPIPGTLTLTATNSTTTNSTVQGVLGGLPGQTYQVDLYANAAADPSGFGEGQTYLGTVPVVISAGGLATFTQTFATPLIASSVVTATATSLLGSTSEFSAAYPNALPTDDLVLTQTVSPATVLTNGIVTFTATITNTGSSPAQGVVYTDALPLSLANVTVTTTSGTTTTTSDNTVLAQLGNLAPGAAVTITISANAAANGSFTNTGGVLGTTPESNYANNQAIQTFTVGPATAPTADLGITITPSSTTPAIGADLTYTLTVTNAGTSDATGVTVNDFLPTNATLISATPSQGSAATTQGNLVSSNLGAIAAGASATLTIVVRPTTSGSLVDSANVSGAQRDPVGTNNSASATVTVAGGGGTTGTPLLSLSQALLPSVATVGQFEIITLTVRNIGTAAATGVIVVDTLPSGVTYGVSGSSQGTAPTFSNNVLTSNLGTIAAGASATVTLVVVPNSFSIGQANFAGVLATGANPTTPVFSSVPLNVPNGPTVAAVAGSRSNGQLVVNFSTSITPATATNRANYLLYPLGSAPRALISADRPIAFTTAVYNATSHSVTLTPSRAIRSNQYYALVIVGSTRNGITDTSGRKLVGTAGGAAGTNYATTFFAGTLPQV